MDQVAAFMEALWAYKPDDLSILVWTLQDKRSQWPKTVGDATSAAKAAAADRDVYVGCALSPRDWGPLNRCRSEDVAAIPGVWADIDVRADLRSNNEMRPSSISEARSIIPKSHPPTIEVSTGNGLHPWWLFKEPWVFDEPAGRERAAILSTRWQAMLRRTASTHGWTLDHTQDLSRILRVPGTLNHKSTPAKPVSLVKTDGPRYSPEDLFEMLDEMGIVDSYFGKARTQSGPRNLILDVNARLESNLLDAYMQVDRKFAATWARQRWDFQDQTQSHYDLALANFGLDAGLNEQQCVNMMIQHRREGGGKVKLRSDYYERTLDVAYQRGGGAAPVSLRKPAAPANGPVPVQATLEQAPPHAPIGEAPAWVTESIPDNNEVRAAAATPAVPAAPARPPAGGPASPAAPAAPPASNGSAPVARGERQTDLEYKATLCEWISTTLGISLIRIIKITGKEPSYVLELEGGKVEISSVSKLISKGDMRNAIAAATNQLIPRIRPKDWDRITEAMLQALTEKDGGMDLDLVGEIRGYLQNYLHSTTVVRDLKEAKADSARHPALIEDTLAVNITAFTSWTNRTFQTKHTPRTLAGALSALGAHAKTLPVGKSKQTRWFLPRPEFAPVLYTHVSPEDAE